MDERKAASVLRETLREQLCCVGRIAARHRLPDDAVWALASGFDLIYERAKHRLGVKDQSTDLSPLPYRLKPHPGLMYLLEKLQREGG